MEFKNTRVNEITKGLNTEKKKKKRRKEGGREEERKGGNRWPRKYENMFNIASN